MIARARLRWLGEVRQMSAIGTKRNCLGHAAISGAEGRPAAPSTWPRQPPVTRCGLSLVSHPEMARQDITWNCAVSVGCVTPPAARRLLLQPALHARVLADGDVEPHPRRALEMRTEDRARREHDAVALRRFRQR